jgi:tellurite resistance protein
MGRSYLLTADDVDLASSKTIRGMQVESQKPTSRKSVPASFFGMPLGLIALGLAWRTAALVWPVPKLIGESLIWAGTALWGLLFITYLSKWIWGRADAEAEFRHPVQCCFVGLAGVVALLASVGLSAEFRGVSVALFYSGLAWTLAFAVYRTGRLWKGGRSPESTTPVLYFPTVAGMLVTASAAASLGHRDWAQIAFGGGFFAWLAIESVVLHRLYLASPVPPALRPTLGVQVAPPAVAAVAYLNVGTGGPDILAHALIGYSMLQALILVRLFPWLREAGLTPAWWSFSFGAAALPTAAMKLVAQGDTGATEALAPYLFAAGNLVIAAIVTVTMILIWKGRLLPEAVGQ